jgi:hypothetical protein
MTSTPTDREAALAVLQKAYPGCVDADTALLDAIASALADAGKADVHRLYITLEAAHNRHGGCCCPVCKGVEFALFDTRSKFGFKDGLIRDKPPAVPEPLTPDQLQRLRGAVAGSDWRPIETAPKDGTKMLICNSVGAMFTGWWNQDMGGVWGDLDAGYLVREGGGPAWWLPLPEQPTNGAT